MYKQHAVKHLLLFTFIMALLMPFYSSCTRKEQPDPVIPANTGSNEQKKPDPKPEYQRPLEETILLSATEDKVEVNGIDEAAAGVTVLFAEPYTFADTEYETVTVGNDYVKKVNVSTTAVEIVFQDDVTARLEFQKEVSLDIDTELSFIGYMSEPVEVPFKVTKLGHGDVSFNVDEATEGFKPEVEYDEESHTGVIRFSLSSLPGAREIAYIFVTDGGENSTTYTITAKTYHFDITVEDITLDGEEGATAPLSFKVDTDIPDYVLEYETEGDFFAFANGIVTTISENRTEAPKTGRISIFESKRVFSPIVVKITQESLPAVPPREDCIVFDDMNFKNAMKALCDTDHDGEVSFDEALTVKEVIAIGADIKDLKGLEYFKNTWKVDLQNNDIVDATVLKELPLLYWLDLKGNKNLKTFDVTGCTQYFEHCEFEVTPELSYYTYRQQVGIINYSDPECEHSHHVVDNRQTTDWSHHKVMHTVQKHSKELESGIVPSIVFTGMGYLDIDMQDGSFERQINEAMRCFWKYTSIGAYKEYFDVYYIEYVFKTRDQVFLSYEKWHSDEYYQVKDAYSIIYEDLREAAYEILYGETEFIVENISKKFPPQLVVSINCIPYYKEDFLPTQRSYDCNMSIEETIDYKICQYRYDFQTHPGFRIKEDGTESENLHRAFHSHTIEELFNYEDHNFEHENSFLQFCGFKIN